MIVEASEPGLPGRYRANTPELFFKALNELQPGTVLYADILAFLDFIDWTPEAQRNGIDPAWNHPFPASEPGVYILRATSVPSGLSAPACLLPEACKWPPRTLIVPPALNECIGKGPTSL